MNIFSAWKDVEAFAVMLDFCHKSRDNSEQVDQQFKHMSIADVRLVPLESDAGDIKTAPRRKFTFPRATHE